MSGRVTEAALVGALAAIVMMVVAAPVLRAPSERIFGMEMVGRHYDPFTVMEQFDQPLHWTASLQPVTDLPGRLLAKWLGSVAAYNVVVLISFPLVAIATYLLARYSALSPAAAAGAALAVAFSPFHFAQAAYHPHIAQLQWVPLYLLALWRCLDRPAWGAIALLVAATAAVTLSNFYGGFIAMVVTPVAMLAHWYFNARRAAESVRRLVTTASTLLVLATAGAGYAFYAAGDFLSGVSTLDFAQGDLEKYGAVWWRYLSPPVSQPWLGSLSVTGAGQPNAASGLLEQQLSLGWGLMALSAVAVAAWLRHRRDRALWAVPVLLAVGACALLCSFAPTTLLYIALPMFRTYARFGSVVQLMIALLAGIGAERLWGSGARPARWIVVALVAITLGEYAVSPAAMWRDVLPTAAHRWVTQQPGFISVLDCYPHTQESQSIQWLTGGRVIMRPRSVGDCREPGLIATLAATGFTHMLVRRTTPEGRWLEGRMPPDGLREVARFGDGEVLAVTAQPSLIRTVATHAFYPAEFDHAWAWRWMGPQASWTVVNTSARALVASVDLETNSFQEPRRLRVVLDGAEVQDVLVDPHRAIHRIGPFALRPGDHTLTFHAASPATVADDRIHNGDRRALSVALGDWRWSVDNGGK